jgi:hypothetical protein
VLVRETLRKCSHELRACLISPCACRFYKVLKEHLWAQGVPSRVGRLFTEETEAVRAPPRLTGNRFQNRGVWPQMGNDFRRYGDVWIRDLSNAPPGHKRPPMWNGGSPLAIKGLSVTLGSPWTRL